MLTLVALLLHAGPLDLPRGHWTVREDKVETCLDVKENGQLWLTFQGPEDRKPKVVIGTYKVTATKMSDYHLEFHVEKITQKQLSKCRERWDETELTEAKGLIGSLSPARQ